MLHRFRVTVTGGAGRLGGGALVKERKDLRRRSEDESLPLNPQASIPTQKSARSAVERFVVVWMAFGFACPGSALLSCHLM